MRYAQASKGQVGYGDEGTDYTKSASLATYFGLVTEDVEPPNENPHSPYATGGERRGPHVLSADPKEHSLDVPYLVLDHEAPFEYALGSRTTTAKDPDGDATNEYNEHLITESDTLPTFTLEHQQTDLDLQSWYIGCKSDLSLSASQGEALSATQSITSGIHDFDDTVTTGYTDLSVPQSKSPFKFWMKGDVSLTATSDGTAVKTIATVTGLDLSWSNGLEVNHHGDGRDGYSVKETTSADKYDHTLSLEVTDTDLFKRAANNEALVDVEIPFFRDPAAANQYDALYIRLKEAKIVDAPIPNASSGSLEADVGILPRTTEIEIREPLV